MPTEEERFKKMLEKEISKKKRKDKWEKFKASVKTAGTRIAAGTKATVEGTKKFSKKVEKIQKKVGKSPIAKQDDLFGFGSTKRKKRKNDFWF